MIKEYEIKKEEVIPGYVDEKGIFKKTGDKKIKFNVYYFEDGKPATSVTHKEFHSYDGISGEIRKGYTERVK